MNYRELNNFVSTSNISIIKHYLNTNELLYDRPIEGYLDWMFDQQTLVKVYTPSIAVTLSPFRERMFRFKHDKLKNI